MSENLKVREKNDLRSMIDSDDFKTQLARVLPKHLTPDRFVRIALTAMRKTPKLMECTQASIIDSMLSLSQAGLEPDGRRAHLVPYFNKKKQEMECSFIVDYKGLVELAIKSEFVSTVHAQEVCENDVFVYNKGIIEKHIIDFKKPRGKEYLYYVIFRMKDGSEKCEVMTLEETEEIRKRSPAGEFGPWKTDEREMRKKTVTRKGSKWVPMSPEYRDVLEKDLDNFDNLNQPSAKALIPPPPLKQAAPQAEASSFESVVGVTVVEEPPSNPATESEPPNRDEDNSEPPQQAIDENDNSIDGLKAKIRHEAAVCFKGENDFSLWLKSLTRNDEKGFRGIDNVSVVKSLPQAKFILGALRKKIADKNG